MQVLGICLFVARSIASHWLVLMNRLNHAGERRNMIRNVERNCTAANVLLGSRLENGIAGDGLGDDGLGDDGHPSSSSSRVEVMHMCSVTERAGSCLLCVLHCRSGGSQGHAVSSPAGFAYHG